MAKKIKFPLEMSGGIQVRTIEELREHFDLMKILGYYLDGKLLTWLNDRYYETEAAQISELNSQLPDFKARLCTILGVKNNFDNEINMEAVERRSAKIAKLKQFIDDEEIINKVDSVAFDQEELANLLDDDVSPIYLLGERFVIPLSKENVTYIGVGAALPIITINSKIPIDFSSKSIIFKNIVFDENYCHLEQEKNLQIKVDVGKCIYKASPMLDFIMNENDRKASERLFGIIQTELLALSYDIDKRSKPLLEILKQERLTDIFEKYLSTIC